MATTAEMKPVGNVKPEVQQQMAGGYRAQGFALAEQFKALIINHAQQLRAMITLAFTYEVKAREEAIKSFRQWSKDLKDPTTPAAQHLMRQGMTEKALNRIANSATTRASEFSTILKAMNGGMTQTTVAEKAGVKFEAVPDLGFHLIVGIAREFNESQAAGSRAGRPSLSFAEKLTRWMDQQPDSKEKKQAMALLDKAGFIIHKEEVKG